MSLNDFNFSKKFNCLWLAPPRTGTRGLTQIFGFMGFEYKNKSVYYNGMPNFTHSFPKDSIDENINILISVRNPYGRLYSMYSNYFEKRDEITFEKFVENLDENFLNHEAYKIFSVRFNHFVRLENRLEDLMKIPFIKNNTTEKQLRLLTEHGKELYDWSSQYSDKMKEKVYYLFENQFKTFGYEK